MVTPLIIEIICSRPANSRSIHFIKHCRPASIAYRKFRAGVNVGVIRPVKASGPERRVCRSSQNDIRRFRDAALAGYYDLLLN